MFENRLGLRMLGLQSGIEDFKQSKEELKQVIILKNHFIIVNNT